MADFILLLHIIRIPLQIGIAIALLVAAPLTLWAWLERSRRLNPFGAAARSARRLFDLPLRPLDRLAARFGAPRTSVPWWGLLAVLLIGALLLGVIDFVRDTLSYAYYATHQGPYSVLRLVVGWTFSILQLGVMARVIMSWIGGHYTVVGRAATALTEWFLGPLRRVLPTIGMIDISPIVAWFLLSLLRSVVLDAIGA
ncbi:YggT family protein [Pseudogemmatithrix spongiicola]|uniref:YggT family protein n=1 Tax=Pseudogemmatithrix spongiicola TaxID=3062599 RepID=A0AA49JXW9_9BACT|nr:YggT family protein [Gemmatimonadaceae bacterium 'strain 138']WKW14041.1 YggT family protein [Gemmatimonadaceae bacterium 'strain 318']